jgi:adenylosuccinate synthase
LIEGEIGEYLQRVGGERGATTGRPRQCGWLDLVLLRYAARLNGFTSFAITKVDVLGGLEEVPVCVRYELPDGTSLTDRPPTSADDLARVRAVYERLPCWGEFHPRLRDRLREDGAEALPGELRAFLSFVTQETGVPVEFVSFGPARDTTIRLGHGPSATPTSRSVRRWKG